MFINLFLLPRAQGELLTRPIAGTQGAFKFHLPDTFAAFTFDGFGELDEVEDILLIERGEGRLVNCDEKLRMRNEGRVGGEDRTKAYIS